jgi:NADH:ubiquinone oxidoreductase subunit 6 (subunit J)
MEYVIEVLSTIGCVIVAMLFLVVLTKDNRELSRSGVEFGGFVTASLFAFSGILLSVILWRESEIGALAALIISLTCALLSLVIVIHILWRRQQEQDARRRSTFVPTPSRSPMRRSTYVAIQEK